MKSTFILLALAIASCHSQLAPRASAHAPELRLVAQSSTFQWNGVAVSDDGRTFAEFPRFSEEPNPCVVRVMPDGQLVPYPGGDWNMWKPGDDPRNRFVSPNAIYIDRKDNHLWVVDPATPNFGEAVPKGPKVVEIDLATDNVVRVYAIDAASAPANSHLNDIRVLHEHAFVTDSGVGALLVIDRDSGRTRRLLAASRLTKADLSVIPIIDGQPTLTANGKPLEINADQIELSADGKTLFFMSPAGPNLYSVSVSDLLDESLTDQALEKRVSVARTVKPVGGIAIDANDTLYLSEIESHTIRAIGRDGSELWSITDPRLSWPDAYSVLSNGTIYVVAAQIDRLPILHGGHDIRQPPYLMFSFDPNASDHD